MLFVPSFFPSFVRSFVRVMAVLAAKRAARQCTAVLAACWPRSGQNGSDWPRSVPYRSSSTYITIESTIVESILDKSVATTQITKITAHGLRSGREKITVRLGLASLCD